MQHTLPILKYSYNALEPHIDAKTMEIHYTKHHSTYVANLNKALEKYQNLQEKSIEELMRSLNNIPEDIRTAVRNNGGGHYNHTLFWDIMSPNGGGIPVDTLADAINKTFEDFEKFKEEFTKTALGRFGSGWVWLVIDETKNLSIMSTPNQDSPLAENKTPILGLDIWEHAYYLNYQNRRADYVSAWWNIVDWIQIEQNYKKITS